MRPGRHAAGDGSFGRSAGAAGGRGLVLIAVALLLGVVLIRATDDEPPGPRLAVGGATGGTGSPDATTTTRPAAATTTTTAPVRAPAEVKLLVANGTRTRGAAAKVSDQLRPAGYNVLAPTDGTAAAESSVYHEAGFEREAAVVAEALQLPASAVKPLPTPVPVSGGDRRGANVVVLAGTELVTRLGGAATTTTARAATTTTARATTTTARATTTTAKP